MTRSSYATLAIIAGMLGCEPELSDVPFACGAEGLCPDGYTCQATVCVREGASLEAARPMRITWVNAGEMYWFPSPAGGATLVVNDGFSQGGRGLYEVSVSPDGKVGDVREVMDFGEEFPTASSVVALDDDHYGVLTLSFPSVSSTEQRLSFWSAPREGRGGAPEIIAEPASQIPFQGGSEPVYIAALARKGAVDVSYADPSEGGRVVIARIQNGTFTERARLPLMQTLPLSADSLLWDLGDDGIAVRVGPDAAELWRIPDGPTPVPEGPLLLADLPVYAFSDRVVVMKLADGDGGIESTLEAIDWSGAPLADDTVSGVLQDALEPFSAVSVGSDSALLAPWSPTDRGFASLEVNRLDNAGGITRIASYQRKGDDELYSARAFSREGKVYLAWTSFHESLMDLWITSVDEVSP
ncbi:MAG: hypothetical protein HOV80_38275 [Polyangiaceae bacterium]|nr:hypothetical protein [Polyangiaceae bacterium]